jgi:hypothetical protein
MLECVLFPYLQRECYRTDIEQVLHEKKPFILR